MSRPLQLEFHGALYHLTARGDGREQIFLDDADRVAFLEVFAQGSSNSTGPSMPTAGDRRALLPALLLGETDFGDAKARRDRMNGKRQDLTPGCPRVRVHVRSRRARCGQ